MFENANVLCRYCGTVQYSTIPYLGYVEQKLLSGPRLGQFFIFHASCLVLCALCFVGTLDVGRFDVRRSKLDDGLYMISAWNGSTPSFQNG